MTMRTVKPARFNRRSGVISAGLMAITGLVGRCGPCAGNQGYRRNHRQEHLGR
jgi:hypothetical protein